jgi:hypothetical protein
MWGEVVFHGDSRTETRRRENGEVAVNLASITDFDPDILSEHADVAIIDCMTFVPEWIPVLHALENQKATRLPFDNGRYLNLWKTNPVETFNSILDSATSADHVFAQNRRLLITQMIEESHLEPIREIRRDSNLKDQLAQELEDLVVETTLDKMQLIAFIDALRNCVHLTQGPPGTGEHIKHCEREENCDRGANIHGDCILFYEILYIGKSYLGVVLVRALLQIRTLWL